MVEWINYEKCTGCAVCKAICPKECIVMEKNHEGFLYPKIDKEQCSSCGLCKSVCPVIDVKYNEYSDKVYAYKNRKEIRERSTSGGFFTLLSDCFIENNGVIYGAEFDEEFGVRHIRADKLEQRDLLKYSKYVQSDLGDIYKNVVMDLLDNREVLFTGTPCQVSGLNAYLVRKKINTDRLLTCDFVCHGVASPLMWKEYLEFIRNKYKDNITAVNFRDKELGWHKPRLKIEMTKHIQALTEEKDPFYQLFYSNCILRKSCHLCQYTKLERVSDITMGDCWGIESSYPQLDDNIGISLVVVNTDKGQKCFDKIKQKEEFFAIKYTDLKQPHLYTPARISKKRDLFWKKYKERGFMCILREYGNYSIKAKMINKIKKVIVKVIR